MYAHIAFPIANYQQFIYSIPPTLIPNIKEGVCIYASFRNKMEYGFVVSLSDKTTFKNIHYTVIAYPTHSNCIKIII